mmetsp:Transcript_46828/g.83977  ORF Transcript_46828/g.83977 Transcript_46828/m.83977 type:complete len:274 (-) Transcript_46828:566-1387(-)
MELKAMSKSFSTLLTFIISANFSTAFSAALYSFSALAASSFLRASASSGSSGSGSASSSSPVGAGGSCFSLLIPNLFFWMIKLVRTEFLFAIASARLTIPFQPILLSERSSTLSPLFSAMIPPIKVAPGLPKTLPDMSRCVNLVVTFNESASISTCSLLSRLFFRTSVFRNLFLVSMSFRAVAAFSTASSSPSGPVKTLLPDRSRVRMLILSRMPWQICSVPAAPKLFSLTSMCRKVSHSSMYDFSFVRAVRLGSSGAMSPILLPERLRYTRV